jgi:hypothetical protein
VFSGGELDIQVTQRPVVTLVKHEAPVEEPAAAVEEEETDSAAVEEEGEPSASSGARFSSLFRSG